MKKLLFTILAFSLMSCGLVLREAGPSALLKKYEWFKNQYQASEQIRTRMNSAQENVKSFVDEFPDRSKWTWQDKDEYQRIKAVYEGYKSQYNSIVADYNAQSSKFNWRGLKTFELPFSLGLEE